MQHFDSARQNCKFLRSLLFEDEADHDLICDTDQFAEMAATGSGSAKIAESYRRSRDQVDRLANAPQSKSSTDFDFARTRDRFWAAGDDLDDRPAARIAIIAKEMITKGWERLVDSDFDENPDEAYEALWDVIGKQSALSP